MNNFHPKLILCPVDFSDVAASALRYATALSAKMDARLLVLYAHQFLPPPHFTAGQVEAMAKTLAHSKQAAHENLHSYVKEVIGDTRNTEIFVVDDLPVAAIINTAEARNADMIVMGTHGHNGINRFLLGSVTERVLRETNRPVLTVHRAEKASEATAFRLQRILCPVNFTETAHRALAYAAAVAKAFNAELLVVHVIEADAETNEAARRERLCQWVPESLRNQCRLKEIAVSGDAPEEIVSIAESTATDLIVLGARHRRFRDTTVIGSTTMRVARYAPCPVLTVVHKEEE
ncbi:MAG: universal stress protein [Acidobacteriota bacterium]